MEIRLSDHFTYGRLIRFTLPSIGMMIFTSIYGIVDGFFVSNFVGGTAFSAMNLIMPFIMILSTVGFMFGTGGSALVAMTLGMGEKKKANEIFSLLIYLLIGLGAVLGIGGYFYVEKVALFLGATPQMLPYCLVYTRISMISLPLYMLQSAFHSFMITAERPQTGFQVTVAAGLTNMVLDGLFMGVLHTGIGGAAAATVIGEFVGGGVPLIYFARKNDSLLRLGRPGLKAEYIVRTVTNGFSELMSDLSMSFISMIYNFQLMHYAGQNGVAAYGIIMYTNFIFAAVFLGYTMGLEPVVGFHYGAENRGELSNLFRRSLVLTCAVSVVMLLFSELFAVPLAMIFAGYDEALLQMTVGAMRIYAISFLAMGFNIFGSGFFTALNNGLLSAVISFVRLWVFQTGAVLLLPRFFGITGVWIAIVAAELLSLLVTAGLLWANRVRYGYM